MLKFRDLIADTVHEFHRMQNFCRIYPARNSKLYDKYFSGNKSVMKVVYKVLYSAEIVPYGIKSNQQVPQSNAKVNSGMPQRGSNLLSSQNSGPGSATQERAMSSQKIRKLPQTAKQIEESK